MKKIGNVVFWIIISILVFVLLYTVYMQFKPNDIKILPGNETENQNSNKNIEEDNTTDKGNATQKDNIGQGKNKEDKNNDTEDTANKTTAPDFTLYNLLGDKVSLSDYIGKVTVVNFWALSCPYCINEMPDLDSANQELLKGEKAEIITINIGDSKEDVEKFIEEKGLTLPVLLDIEGQVARIYGVNSIPITFVINKDGSAYGYISGQTDKDTILRIIEDME